MDSFPIRPTAPADLRSPGGTIKIKRQGTAVTLDLDPAVLAASAFLKGDKGDKGEMGAGVQIQGSVASPSALPATGKFGDTYIVTTTGSGYASGDGYTYTGSGNDAGPGGNWHNVGQIRGPAGSPAVVNGKSGPVINLVAADVGALDTQAGGTVAGPLNLSKRLTGTFTTANDTPFFNYSSSEVGYTAGGGTNAFYIPEAWIHSSVNPVGHRELKHFELHTTGAAQGKFNVCATFISWGHPASGGGTSSGSLFGTNSVVVIEAGMSASTEASAAEFNTVVKGAVARKTGIQVVDAPGSVGSGTIIDAAVLLGKGDSTAVGYNNGIQFGAQGDTSQFPVKGTLILSDFGTCSYGIDLRRTSLTGGQALLLNAGHAITWAGSTGGAITNNGAGTNGPQLIFGSGLLLTGRNDGSTWLVQDVANNILRPGSDNGIALGASNYRFNALWVSSGTVNSSDGTLKKNLGPPDDALLDAIGDVDLVLFQYLDAIAAKGGDAARIHSGVIAQQVRDALIARGLDPARYAFWCADPLTEEVDEPYETDEPIIDRIEDTEERIEIGDDGRAVMRIVPVIREEPRVETLPVYNEDGTRRMTTPREARTARGENGEVVTIPAQPSVPMTTTRPIKEKKTLTRRVTKPVLGADGKQIQRLGIRYGDLAMLLHAWTRRELKRLGTARAA